MRIETLKGLVKGRNYLQSLGFQQCENKLYFEKDSEIWHYNKLMKKWIKTMKQADEIPASCSECEWEGKLSQCIPNIPAAIRLQPGFINEINPTCPKCYSRVGW